MQFIISQAHAQAAQQPQQPDMFTGLFLPMIFLAVVFYFLIIRPQSKRAKEHKSMLADLSKGGENFVEIEVSDGVSVRVQKHAIASLMPKGTLKSTD